MPETNYEEWRERIDADVKTLGERLVSVEVGISNLGRTLDRIYQSFENNAQNQRDMQKTQWPVIFGVLSLVLIIVGGVGSGYLRDQNRIEKDVTMIKNNRISANDPVQDQRLHRLEQEVLGLQGREHAILQSGAELANTVEAMERIRADYIGHVRDGHPQIIRDKVTNLSEQVDHRLNEVDARLRREIEIQEGYRQELQRQTELMEERWANEHTKGHNEP
jgi:hypothetical protein